MRLLSRAGGIVFAPARAARSRALSASRIRACPSSEANLGPAGVMTLGGGGGGQPYGPQGVGHGEGMQARFVASLDLATISSISARTEPVGTPSGCALASASSRTTGPITVALPWARLSFPTTEDPTSIRAKSITQPLRP